MARRTLIAIAAVAVSLLVGAGAVAALLISGGDGDEQAAASGSSEGARGYLGLTVTTSPTQGLRVASVEADGPAAKAGIQVGDFLRSIDGQVVRTPEQLKSAVESKSPGTQVSVTYERAEQELHASVKLGTAPADAQIEASPEPNAQANPGNRGPNPGGANPPGRGQLGVQIQNITPELKQRYGLTRDSGIVITDVQAGSAADKAGLKAGDVITEVNGRHVNSAEDVTRAIVGAAGTQQVEVEVLRGTAQMEFTVQTNSVLFPGFDKLPPQVQQRLLDLYRSGRYTPEQLQRLAAGQNNLRVGTVKSISDTSLTITPLESSADVTYTLTSTTEYRSGANAITRNDIQAGNTVLVISLDGQSALGVFFYAR